MKNLTYLNKSFVICIVLVIILSVVAFIVTSNVNKNDASNQIKESTLRMAPLKSAEKVTIKTDAQRRVSLGAE